MTKLDKSVDYGVFSPSGRAGTPFFFANTGCVLSRKQEVLAIAGLWWDGKGDCKRADEAAQQDEGRDGLWVRLLLLVTIDYVASLFSMLFRGQGESLQRRA